AGGGRRRGAGAGAVRRAVAVGGGQERGPSAGRGPSAPGGGRPPGGGQEGPAAPSRPRGPPSGGRGGGEVPKHSDSRFGPTPRGCSRSGVPGHRRILTPPRKVSTREVRGLSSGA